jgi:sporulation protein YlmC with PRC-barrel domain
VLLSRIATRTANFHFIRFLLDMEQAEPLYKCSGTSASRNEVPVRGLMSREQAESIMTTATGHTRAILASKVKGTAVYNKSGDKVGTVEDIVLDKQSDRIMFAALGQGGVLGVGEKFFPVPWSMLDYSKEKDGYVIPVAQDVISKAPTIAWKI